MKFLKEIFTKEFFIEKAYVFAYISILFLVGAVIQALPTMILWNWLMPKIFNVESISFIEAIGLCFLSGLLFKNHK